MKLRAILVDDECSDSQELRNLLQPFENVQVVSKAANALEARELILNLDDSTYNTAHEEYAFALNALEHLLKPIHPKRLEEALLKVRQLKGNLTGPKSNPPPIKRETIPPKPLEVVPVELRGKIILLHQDEIIYVYTDKDKVYIKSLKESYLTRFTLRELELRLNSTLFFRSHRCYLVNIQRMRELIPYFNGTYTIVVDDLERSEIPMSRTKSRILKEMLGL
ncbi:LytTR family DNA-binding domain-containing protein [Desulfosporosinus sp. BICA1-9]|uniref:LytR/AlgR family response regulator transcription factor n=1 Tax=Desulfosporosinus sp. BICA1-9 TaxID=1531958 RepID=UPI00054C50AE|nr:LytTR family transcriptional regulator DNA-binding domain-containing protein [Desulfosporosinus sp. BICA1-9]KJS47144.1 MAG: hypothetical protein VR66_21245 [Peptococcaceae bacterium BRH_c23]KJS85993.1 MAG: hypothetical protein JL57_17610 [Desulfosporosinus sp. BICA1-9]HBW35076.1 DNA-binding protein [Desulfosporosinus sp.]